MAALGDFMVDRRKEGPDVRTLSLLGEIELDDWRGERVRLGDLWSERPVVLVFIRHFG